MKGLWDPKSIKMLLQEMKGHMHICILYLVSKLVPQRWGQKQIAPVAARYEELIQPSALTRPGLCDCMHLTQSLAWDTKGIPQSDVPQIDACLLWRIGYKSFAKLSLLESIFARKK